MAFYLLHREETYPLLNGTLELTVRKFTSKHTSQQFCSVLEFWLQKEETSQLCHVQHQLCICMWLGETCIRRNTYILISYLTSRDSHWCLHGINSAWYAVSWSRNKHNQLLAGMASSSVPQVRHSRLRQQLFNNRIIVCVWFILGRIKVASHRLLVCRLMTANALCNAWSFHSHPVFSISKYCQFQMKRYIFIKLNSAAGRFMQTV